MTKRVLALALLTLNFSLSLPMGSGHAFTLQRRFETCRYASLDGRGAYNDWEVRSELACASAHFPVPGGFGTVLWIAERESGLYPHAENPYSGACGLLQSLPSLWPQRLSAFRAAHPFMRLLPSCFEPRSSALVMVWLMHVGGLGPWR